MAATQPLIFITATGLWLLFGKFVFGRVKKDYQKSGQLSSLTGSLEILVFAFHAQLLFTFSYWNVFALSARDIFSPSYWYETWPSMSSSSASLFLGMGLGIVGVAIFAWGIGVFGSFKRMVGQQVDELKVSGIYRWTRNPQIVGYGLVVLSIPLFWNSLYAAVASVVFWFGAHMMVLSEEDHLHRIYGKAYEDYCRSTPRYFIF